MSKTPKAKPKFKNGETVIYNGQRKSVVSCYRKTLDFKKMGYYYTLDDPTLEPIPEDQLEEFSLSQEKGTWVIMDDPTTGGTSSPEELKKILEWWEGFGGKGR